jgi:hypothetical protein
LRTEPIAADTLTISGIAIFAYIFGNVMHEAVGHGALVSCPAAGC